MKYKYQNQQILIEILMFIHQLFLIKHYQKTQYKFQTNVTLKGLIYQVFRKKDYLKSKL